MPGLAVSMISACVEVCDLCNPVSKVWSVYVTIAACMLLTTWSTAKLMLLLQAIWMELQETVHAVDAMTTKTPQEVA
jgi:hypothetical protein